MTALRRVAPLSLLLLLGVFFALAASDNTAQAQVTGPTPQNVATDWSLIPDGLGEGDQFRLLFVTSGTRDATSGDIADYNTFVQNAANDTGVDATIRGMSGEFRAVVSTFAVDARDNTATHPNADISIYWLGGDQAADDYADFYDNSWDSLQGKNELAGDLRPQIIYTGSNTNGTERQFRYAGAVSHVRYGSLALVSPSPLSHADRPKSETHHLYALSPVLTVGTLVPPAPLTYEVPNDWPLKPSGLAVNSEFRLLFLSEATRNATSSNIYHYNSFVQGDDVLGGASVDATIRALRGEFRALVSTQNVDARDNTATTGTGVAIYWLDGDKVADDYGDFYDGSWGSSAARDEEGDTFTANPDAWTGSGNDGTEYFDGSNSRALGAGSEARYGDVDANPLNQSNAANTGVRSIYAISPVFKVVDQGAPTGQDVPGNWPLIPSGLGGGDQFRLIFLTSGTRDATSTSIAHYNLFVQAHAGGGHEAIKPYRNQFRALASTASVDAQDNAAVTFTDSDKGVAIYALSVDASGNFNGARVAEDYENLCSFLNDWENTARKDESGASISSDLVWTGSHLVNDICEGRAGAELGTAQPRTGSSSSITAAFASGITQSSSNNLPLYCLSPVFTVVTTDYDSDDDGLIEVGTLAQLNAIRWDPDSDGAVTDIASTTGVDEAAEYALGFPSPADDQCDDPNTGGTTETCDGYELTADLDFDTDGSGDANSADDYWDGGAGWEPIGTYTATFEGNGHTIANLFINRSATDDVGLFGSFDGSLRNLGLADVNVTGQTGTGALAGNIGRQSSVSASWATGSVTGENEVGGLVGTTGFSSQITASYAAVSVTGVYDAVDVTGGEQVGGLVGNHFGGSVAASYATGSVDGDYDIGGLVGRNFRGSITASYATGMVSGDEDVGGVVGRPTAATVTDSYYDAETTGRAFGIGTDDGGPPPADRNNNVVDANETNSLPGHTTAELQDPTGYSGIYANWNVDLDADSIDDDPWDFGTGYNYPALKVDFDGDGTATYQEFGVQRGAAPPSMLLASSGLDTSNDAILEVTWNAPTSGNPAAPTGYQYRYSSDAGVTWNPDWPSAETDANWLDAATTTFTIPAPLAQRYEIEVRATFAAPLPTSEATRTVGGGTDYDADADGLIEITSVARLNAVRWDIDGDGIVTDNTGTSLDEAAGYLAAFPTPAFGMGCPLADHDSNPRTDAQPVCTGYELTANLDFDENDDGSRNDTYNTGSGWEPIGSFTGGYFIATFEGNGHTISNLFINRSATDGVGLFGEGYGTLRNLGLEDADVTGQDRVGALAGWSNGIITHSWATGSVTGRNHVGGLIGEIGQFQGTITSSSYAAVSVVSSGYNVGGLVGHLANGNVLATYATGSVTGTNWVGGLVGYNTQGAIIASYATGSVSGTENAGGLMGGWADFQGATVTDSYHDAQTTGRFFGIGQNDNGSGTNADNNVVDAGETNSLPGGTTAQLQTPTGYSGIYAGWNVDLDNADDDGDLTTGGDNPWDFGANDEYPILRNVGGFQRLTDYDIDDDGLIDVDTLAKLDAIRYDLDGDGSATNDAYDDAFLGPMANMGCPTSGCTGYELTADLDFDQNGGSGWAPIGDNSNPFAATFEGNGRTISNLFIDRGAANYVGLFGATASNGVVRNLGVADVQVQGRTHVGALVGNNLGRVSASWANGSVTSTDDSVGGLVGSSEGVIAASYSAASVSATGSGSNNTGGLVGLLSGANASIVASYATGRVSGDSDLGGLVGAINTGVITASYSTGAVSGNDDVGGLVGVSVNATVTASYWDTVRSGLTTSAAGTGKTGAELCEPTAYGSGTDIYATWNLDLDGNGANDNPWDFGADYNYPTLRDAGGKQKGPGPVGGVTAAFTRTGESEIVQLVVSWNAPTDYGDGNPGNVATGAYGSRYSSDGGTVWISRTIRLSAVEQFGTTYTIAGPDAAPYRIEVWAIGHGAAHTEGKRVSIALPGPPQMVRLISFDRRIDASWSAPADTGGSAISGYRLDWRQVGAASWTTLTLSGTTRSFTNLVSGGSYEFRIAATNADGTGPYTQPLSAIASNVVDYDSDGDGLIEIRTLAQLNAVRWDVDGDGVVTDDTGTANLDEAAVYAAAFPQAAAALGCPADGCAGYELMADLDFDIDGDGDVDADDGRTDSDLDADDDGNADGGAFWNDGDGWRPIGTSDARFIVIFEGNGHTIANLFINRAGWDRVGLFGRTGSIDVNPAVGATIRNLVLTGASVTGDDRVGILAGETNWTTSISNVTVSGSVTGDDYVGGLIGNVNENIDGNSVSGSGRVTGSSASGSVTATDDHAGGLVGQNEGTIAASYASAGVSATGSASASTGGLVGTNEGHIMASYATGSVSGVDDVGGLVGEVDSGGNINFSYSTGVVSGSGTGVGGLMGSLTDGTVTSSYWDMESSGQTTSVAGTGKTGEELRAPTGYTGIYSAWNVDVDGVTGNDNPWDFGASYNYPTLRNAPGNQQGPGPVGDMNATLDSGGTGAVVRWAVPTDTGAGRVTGYQYRLSTDGGSTWSPDWTDTNLGQTAPNAQNFIRTAGESYTFEARAVSDAAHMRGVAQRIVPPQNAPRNLSVLLYTGRVDLFWDAPQDDGGPDVTGYAVQYKASSDTTWLTTNVVITGRSATITGLANGTTYNVRVAAVSTLGVGTYSTAIDAVPTATQRVPAAPTGLTLTPGNQRMEVSWTAPRDLGNPPLTGYSVQYRVEGASSWSTWTHTGTGTTATITGLTSDLPYQVQVAAVNAQGTGPYTDIVTQALVRVPGVPRSLEAKPGDGSIEALWFPPADLGLPPLNEYIVQYRQRTDPVGVWKELSHDGSVPPHQGATPKLRLTITGLTNGEEYLVRVAAVNEQGTSPYTATASATPFSLEDLPGEPKNLRVYPSDARLDVRWEAPDHLGDPELTHYLVSIPRTGIPRTVDAPDTATVYKDRVNGRAYQVSVAACNRWGCGPSTPPVTATPEEGLERPDIERPPSAPRDMSLTPGDGQITVSWNEPSDLGKPADGTYLVEYRKAGTADEWTETRTEGTTATLTGLTNGQAYEVQVTAYNDHGGGVAGPQSVAPVAPPSVEPEPEPEPEPDPNRPPTAPRNLRLEAGDGWIRVTWSAPEDMGNPDAWIGYVVESRLVGAEGSGGWFEEGLYQGTTATIDATNGQSYQVRVLAVNEHGSAAVGPHTARPTAPEIDEERPPTAPRNLSLKAGDGIIEVSWQKPWDKGEEDAWLGYIVEIRTVDESDWFEDGVYTGTSATIDYVDNGVTYEVRVTAFNLYGQATAGPKTATPFASPPDDSDDGDTGEDETNPASLTLTPGDGQISVSWSLGDMDKSVVEGYIVEYREASGSEEWFEEGWFNGTSATVEFLESGVEYEVRVLVLNENIDVIAVIGPRRATPR